jgi:phospholipid/cholesterol/gamma-HCH transport system permease protein
MRFADTTLPPAAQRLLTLVCAADTRPATVPDRPSVRIRLGQWTIGTGAEVAAAAEIVGDVVLRGVAAVGGRAKMRAADLWGCARDAGAAALPIVTVVNFLIGGILAFAGAVQLRWFGAEIYVANAVGIAVAREMAAVMTAIVMAGRTGGAYAAHIATMQGNEEIDALRAIGIPVQDYLILPRVLALTAMMPVLYLYACAIGLLGGFTVAAGMLDITPIAYFEQTRSAVSGTQFLFGFGKSIAFGALVALAACRIGLRAGRSAADVGRAATRAVVAGIVGVIALDAVFAVCANALGF